MLTKNRDWSTFGLCVAMIVGIAMAALPWVSRDGNEPAPLPAAFAPDDSRAAPLLELLAAHDRACASGDVVAFQQCVTEAHYASVSRSLAALDRSIDAATLRARVENGAGLAAIATRPGCRGRAQGDRACILGKPQAGLLGSLCIGLVRHAGAWRVDRVVHQPLVALDDATLVDVLMAGMLTAQ